MARSYRCSVGDRGHGPIVQAICRGPRAWSASTGVLSGIAGMVRSRGRFVRHRGHGPLLQAHCQASRRWSDPAGVLSGIAGVVRSYRRFIAVHLYEDHS
jgi:hypothetical protein